MYGLAQVPRHHQQRNHLQPIVSTCIPLSPSFYLHGGELRDYLFREVKRHISSLHWGLLSILSFSFPIPIVFPHCSSKSNCVSYAYWHVFVWYLEWLSCTSMLCCQSICDHQTLLSDPTRLQRRVLCAFPPEAKPVECPSRRELLSMISHAM